MQLFVIIITGKLSNSPAMCIHLTCCALPYSDPFRMILCAGVFSRNMFLLFDNRLHTINEISDL